MKKFNIMCLLILLTTNVIRSQDETAAGEIIIYVINNSGGAEIKIEFQTVGTSLCWNAINYPNYYDVHDITTQFPGTYQITTENNKDLNWEACWSTEYDHMFGLGYYKVTAYQKVSGSFHEKDFFYIDYRTSDLSENNDAGGSGDVKVDFNVGVGVFYKWNTSELFPTYTAIWAQKPWIANITTEFEPLAPEYLYWYNFYKHPQLQWSHSTNPYDYVTEYEIHRNLGGGWELIDTRPDELLHYVDWEIDLEGQPEIEYLYYKIRAKNGNRVSNQFSNIVKVAGPAEFGKISDELITELNNQYQYKLEQNYPNPFNPSTSISFSLEEEVQVTLKIFDILGRQVAILLSETLAAGNHQIKFDGGSLKSGIYFYEIIAGKFRSVRKFILLK
jgi:hypothetical protein